MKRRRSLGLDPNRFRTRQLRLEQLEPRTLLATLTPGNILVASTKLPDSAKLYEFTVDGTLVQAIDIPTIDEADDVRDLTVDSAGQVQIYHGTFNPELVTWQPATETLASREFDGWSTANNVTYGGIAAWGDFIFATDMNTSGAEARGVLRVNIHDLTMDRFATELEPIDLNIGPDGLLYVLPYAGIDGGGNEIHVFDPATLERQRIIALPRVHRAIAIDTNGDIFAANPDIYHYSPNGVLIGDPYDRGLGGLADIDLDADGRILVASSGGDVGITDRDFNAWVQFTSRLTYSMTFATFVSGSRGFPKAMHDTLSVRQNSQDNVLDVVTNDQPSPGDALEITAVGTPDYHGTVQVTGDQRILYTPAPGFTGVETFTYSVRDGSNRTDQAIVSVRVTAVNTVIAGDDAFTTGEETSLVVPANLGLLANDRIGGPSFAGALTEGNIIMTNSPIGEPAMLYEYTPDGQSVSAVEISLFGSTERARDLVLDRNGNVQIYNGTFNPRLSAYLTSMGEFTQTQFAGWDTVNNLTFGGIAAYGDYVFASDTVIAFDSQTDRGVVRFNVQDLTIERFAASENDVIDVVVGRDGLVYTLTGSGSPIGNAVHVYDPITLDYLRSVSLPRTHRAIMVDQDGNLYGAGRDDGDLLYKYLPDGTEAAQFDPDLGGLCDLDLNADGLLLVASHGGTVALTDTEFSFVIQFSPRVSSGTAFAAFVQLPLGLGSGSLRVVDHTQPGHGSVTVSEDGSFQYDPQPDFVGTDNFTYVLEDDAGSQAVGTVAIEVTNSNDSPRLASAGPSAETDEDTALVLPISHFVNNGPETTVVMDVDPADPVGGLAIIGVEGPGSWAYSLDGTTFLALEDAREQEALLLDRTAWVRYTPVGDNAETAHLQFHAWDTTSGAAGSRHDVSTRGGATAFSAAGDTLRVDVSDRNDAPLLLPGSPQIGDTSEDAAFTAPLGDFVTGLTDVDDGAVVGGLAVVELVGRGQWAFSLDGNQFMDFGSVAVTSARLLPFDGFVRYTPDAKNGEVATIRYRGWDASSGVVGQLANTQDHGGTTAFSVATDVAALTVTDVNDAPTLNPQSPTVASTNEDTAVDVRLRDFVGGIADVDWSATVGGIAVTFADGAGAWLYSLTGSDFLPLPNVTPEAALLLDSEAWLRYEPDGRTAEQPTLRFRAWDATSGTSGAFADSTLSGGSGAFSVASDILNVQVTSVNDAPVLTAGAPVLTTLEQQALTFTLSDFVNAGAVSTRIEDVDADSVSAGIAVFATSGNGVYTYSLDGAQFVLLGSVSQNQALLLTPTARIRYFPRGDNGEVASVTYFAWDRSSGSDADRVAVTERGGTTPFSLASDVLSLVVTDVNDPPEAIALDNTTVSENALGATIGLLTVDDPDAGDTHVLTVDDERFEVGGQTLKLRGDVVLDHEAEPVVSLRVTATDSGGKQVAATFTIAVQDLAEPPQLVAPPSAQTTAAQRQFEYTVPAGMFTDPDVGDKITYSAAQANGDPLPSWLDFEVTTRAFAGWPTDADTGTLVIRIVARDLTDRTNHADFSLTVDPNPTPWRNPRLPFDVDADERVVPRDALMIINRLSKTNGNAELPEPPAVPPPYLDVSGDNRVTPRDALLVINYLSRHGAGEGEGESVAAGALASWPSAEPHEFADNTPAAEAFQVVDLAWYTAPQFPTPQAPQPEPTAHDPRARTPAGLDSLTAEDLDELLDELFDGTR